MGGRAAHPVSATPAYNRGVAVGRRTGHVQIDHPLGPRRVVEGRFQRLFRSRSCRFCTRYPPRIQQATQGEPTQPQRAPLQEVPAAVILRLPVAKFWSRGCMLGEG